MSEKNMRLMKTYHIRNLVLPILEKEKPTPKSIIVRKVNIPTSNQHLDALTFTSS